MAELSPLNLFISTRDRDNIGETSGNTILADFVLSCKMWLAKRTNFVFFIISHLYVGSMFLLRQTCKRGWRREHTASSIIFSNFYVASIFLIRYSLSTYQRL